MHYLYSFFILISISHSVYSLFLSTQISRFSNNYFSQYNEHSYLLSRSYTEPLYAKKKTDIVPIDSENENINEKKLGGDNNKNDLRNEALMGVLYQIEKSYGKGSIQRLGQQSNMIVETTSSGAITLDIALG